MFPFLNSSSVISSLKGELSKYLAAAAADINRVEWWKRHENDLRHWSRAYKLLLLIQPSSAAAERVFSILSNSFNDRQTSSLQDYNHRNICDVTVQLQGVDMHVFLYCVIGNHQFLLE